MRNAINGLVNTNDEGFPVRAELLEAGGHVAVDHLTIQEVALEICSNEVDAVHGATLASSERK